MAIPPKNLDCIHAIYLRVEFGHPAYGLCATCQAAFDADPDSWLEFGDHPAGVERQRLALNEYLTPPPAVSDESKISF